MKRAILALVALTALTTVGLIPGASTAETRQRGQHLHTDREVPAKAIEVYEYVLRNGKAPKGYVGGRIWQNRERRLPLNGHYQEYDVNPKVTGRNRGAERVIIDIDRKNGWYTADHYQTFIPIRK